jgi:hypothetical protein
MAVDLLPECQGDSFVRADIYQRTVLTVIALLLCILALRPAANPTPVLAQPAPSFLYVEPGVTALRRPDGTEQVQGKVIIDLRTGDVYGFPTLSGAPYPVDTTKPEPPVSQPMYLGRFDLTKMRHP